MSTPAETIFPIPTEQFNPKARALALGMPENVWEQFAAPEDMGALQFGNVALTYLNLPIIEPKQPDPSYIRAFHPAVFEYFSRMFHNMTRAGYYFTNDPDIPPFIVDDSNKFMLYANHYLGLQNPEVREFAIKASTSKAEPPSVVTRAPRTLSAEQIAARQEKQRKSENYAAWLESCAAYRVEVAQLRARYEEARDYTEARRLELRVLEAEGAPKRPL